jgi:uncharacterized protein YdaT
MERRGSAFVSKELNMSQKRDYHVVPHPEGWAVRREGAQRASEVCPTQAKAIEAGRELAKEQHTELVIHDRHGRIRDSDSYGNDPVPPHDKKH